MHWLVLARSGCPTWTTSTVAPITTSQSPELIAPCPSTKLNLLHWAGADRADVLWTVSCIAISVVRTGMWMQTPGLALRRALLLQVYDRGSEEVHAGQ